MALIVVLSGPNSGTPGTTPPHAIHSLMRSRLDKALELHASLKEKQSQDPSIEFLVSGRARERSTCLASSLMAEYLVTNNIPPHLVFEESRSRNTIENCLFIFSFASTCYQHLYLITSRFHLQRARAIFDHFSPQFNFTTPFTFVCADNCLAKSELREAQRNELSNIVSLPKMLEMYENKLATIQEKSK